MEKPACHHCAPEALPVNFGAKFLGSLVCAIPVWALSMQHSPLSGWIQFVGVSLSLFLFGWPLLERAWASFKQRAWNMFSLIGVGLLSSWSLSLWRLIHPDESWIQGFYFEGTATLICFVLLGQFLENRASQETGKAVAKLISWLPQRVRKVISDNREEDVPLAEVKKGDLLRVLPGHQVPLDGILTEGQSALDESLLTGESMPVEKQKGDPVFAGTVNGLGTFLFRVTHLERETQVFKIADLVAKVQNQKVPIQKLADRISATFTKWVFGIALLTGLIWWIAGPEPRGVLAVLQAVSVLMIACPCALGLATPIAVMVGTRLAAREGVLFRQLDAIQQLEKIDTVIFDKTGTLTEGKPRVVTFMNLDPKNSPHSILQAAASLESVSEHPLARAIVQYAQMEKVKELLPVSDFRVSVGKGAQGRIQNQEVAIGSEAFANSLTNQQQDGVEAAKKMRDSGQTVLFFLQDQRVKAIFGIQDPLREEALTVLTQLKRKGLQLVLASGDHPRNTERVAQQLGIEKWYGGVSPTDKFEIVRSVQALGHQVAFLGDGINDAPALTQANVGISVESSTEMAKQSAPVSLLRGGLQAFETTLSLSREMMNHIRQNLFWAFVYNILGIPLAAGVFYPLWGIRLTPAFSSVAMTLSSLFVLGNSIRLKYKKFRIAK